LNHYKNDLERHAHTPSGVAGADLKSQPGGALGTPTLSRFSPPMTCTSEARRAAACALQRARRTSGERPRARRQAVDSVFDPRPAAQQGGPPWAGLRLEIQSSPATAPLITKVICWGFQEATCGRCLAETSCFHALQ
jgi:hypothetical protein